MENQSEKQKLNISVRELVEFIFREGDIDNRRGQLANQEAMLEGSKMHRKIQKSKGPAYRAEVPLRFCVDTPLYELVIDGRADGVFVNEDGIFVIDEIKGVYRNLSHMEQPVYVHQAQAMCYAYIYAIQNHQQMMAIQMTYVNLDIETIKYFQQEFSLEELSEWFEDLIARYRKWADFQVEWRKKRQASIMMLQFPYPYRQGQKKLVTDVYRTISRKKTLFLQAPTGVGKTISTIFPAVKALGEGLADHIFYLTAKTITGTVAKDTFLLLNEHGYAAKTIQLTAKEKLCLCEEMECDPVHCPYAKGHFDRINDAVYELLLERDLFTREDIWRQAEKYRVCPFEMSLDLASWVDHIICDYNYVYDPNVCLKRFFAEGVKGKYIFLVDEAHNLVERSREMYSASLYKEDFLMVKKIIKPYSRKIERLCERCNKQMLELKRECEDYRVLEHTGTLSFALMSLASEMADFLQVPMDFAGRKDVLRFYFDLRNFLRVEEESAADDGYEIYSEIQNDGRFMLRQLCVDPSMNLQKRIDKGVSTIFFSATLLPIQYYKRLLSTRTDNYAVYAESTFRTEQRLLMFGTDVSSRYTRRTDAEFQKISAYIKKTVSAKRGNYMVFFPSYKMMEQVYAFFEKEDSADFSCILQQSGMKEEEREAFLRCFEEKGEKSLIAFCVMGGIFSEGIDLTQDRLIGVIVVGTGLPQICNEREILKKHYDERSENGFDYAFRFPGLNKVLQSAGRVIRTTEDKGVIVLLDERFMHPEYQHLYPREWNERCICTIETAERHLKEFWKQ